jgi:hypothetical protein
MAQASATIDIPAAPDRVWQLIGGFGSLPDWLPSIPKCELREGGRVRRFTTVRGDFVVERLEAFDNAARSYTYTILEAPLPVTGYRSTLRVREVNGGTASRVEWLGEFTPSGVSDQEAARQFQGFYEDSLKALATRFAPLAQEVTP